MQADATSWRGRFPPSGRPGAPMPEPPTVEGFGSDERELWGRVRELWQLSLSPDAAQIRETLHPDYVGWDMSAPLPHSREVAVRSVTDAHSRTVAYSLDPLSVRVYEGRTGVVHY